MHFLMCLPLRQERQSKNTEFHLTQNTHHLKSSLPKNNLYVSEWQPSSHSSSVQFSILEIFLFGSRRLFYLQLYGYYFIAHWEKLKLLSSSKFLSSKLEFEKKTKNTHKMYISNFQIVSNRYAQSTYKGEPRGGWTFEGAIVCFFGSLIYRSR